jgi:hypothetical protein
VAHGLCRRITIREWISKGSDRPAKAVGASEAGSTNTGKKCGRKTKGQDLLGKGPAAYNTVISLILTTAYKSENSKRILSNPFSFSDGFSSEDLRPEMFTHIENAN